jgi:hypothetical protein
MTSPIHYKWHKWLKWHKNGSNSNTNGINNYYSKKRLVIECNFWHNNIIFGINNSWEVETINSYKIQYNFFFQNIFPKQTQNIIFIRSLMCIRINLYHLIVILTKWLTNVEYKTLKIDCENFLQNVNWINITKIHKYWIQLVSFRI